MDASTVKEHAMENGPISIEDILLIDREIFGANRSELLRSLAQEAPHLTLVDRQRGKSPDTVSVGWVRVPITWGHGLLVMKKWRRGC